MNEIMSFDTHNNQHTVARVIRVVVPLFLPNQLDYTWDYANPPQIGELVEVPVRGKNVHAMVVDILAESPFKNLKKATKLEGVPALSPQTCEFYRWVARYTLAAPGEGLRAALIKGQVPERYAGVDKLFLTGNAPSGKLTAQRQKVMDFITANNTGWGAGELAEKCSVSSAVVQGLMKLGALEWRKVEDISPSPSISLPNLNESQAAAAGEIAASLHKGKFETFLLDGVTGSGKTEVYFDAVVRMLEQDESSQALILVPEISLTPQWLNRFEQRFGFAPTVWHSGLTEVQRRRNWWQVLECKARVVIGARSALFLPFKNLKFIVVDEEHEPSYKQEDKFRYHGRDMAVALGKLWKATVMLASATPSLETWHNSQIGRYKWLQLKGRHGTAKMPSIELIDLREKENSLKGDNWLSPVMIDKLKTKLKNGEQSLVFLNRRGVAPLLICRGCGYRYDCPNCDASLVVHGKVGAGRLVCHHCGYKDHWPETCPKCESDKLHPFGPGTRKIQQQLKEILPQARVAVADSDSVTSERQMGELLARMEKSEIDVLVGTQMVAKGHHLPNLTFVGVVDADMGLAHGDLRAAERTFQLLTQVAGRAGRAEKHGEVMLQTHDPEHPLFSAILDMNRHQFYDVELKGRKPWGDPPFGRLVAVLLSGADEASVRIAGQRLAQNFPTHEGVRVLGPAPAPISRIADRFRYRLLVKVKPEAKISTQNMIKSWVESVEIPTNVRLEIDVDPVRFS